VDIENLDEKAISKQGTGEFTEKCPKAIYDSNGKGDTGQWSDGNISNGVP